MAVSNSSVRNEREVGRVVSISSYRLTVLVDPEIRSQVKAYGDRIATVSQIGGYILFPVAPGEKAVGIVVGASEDENIEADPKTGMTLQLTQPRRTLKLNLLGELHEELPFVPGISVYPILDAQALLPTEAELKRILEFVPGEEDRENDVALSVGSSPIYPRQAVTGSYNDIDSAEKPVWYLVIFKK